MWQLLMEIVLLLATAFVLGTVAQRLKQSAIIGYLMAGVIVGPMLFNAQAVEQVAELGVALLLFSIGLEFSFSRLRQLGTIALIGGTAQVVITLGVYALVASVFMNTAAAVVLGAMVALSSTAVVLRVLVDRSSIDSVHGRNALGILLMQDIAVVPLVLLVTIMTQGGGSQAIAAHITKTLVGASLLVVAFYFLFYRITPKILMSRGVFANRELVVMLAIISALGSIWSAHVLGLSPALGAFLAGILLAESPFAAQIRSDIVGIRTLFVTLFFTSVGMLADPLWFVQHLHWVAIGLVLVVVGKTVIIYAIARALKFGPAQALATGLTLAQIGEFSFVLASTAQQGLLLGANQFALVVSVTIVSMFLAPYMVTHAEVWALWLVRRLFPSRLPPADPLSPKDGTRGGNILIIGFGPAGQRVAQTLIARDFRPLVIELNPRSAHQAQILELPVHIGDATNSEVLEHAGIHSVCAVVVTLPDPATSRNVIANLKAIVPEVPIIVRARYHRLAEDLKKAGATVIVDEELTLGEALDQKLQALLLRPQQEALACALAGQKPVSSAEANSAR
jgi:monovalent cation:H+ antiporter-2, CPA2 family